MRYESSRLQTDTHQVSVGLCTGAPFWLCRSSAKEMQLKAAQQANWRAPAVAGILASVATGLCRLHTPREKLMQDRQWARGSREEERERGNRGDMGMAREHRIQ